MQGAGTAKSQLVKSGEKCGVTGKTRDDFLRCVLQ